METLTFMDEITDLYLTTYIIGYDGVGESIIILLSSKDDKKKIYFLGVVDSYATSKTHQTEKLLGEILKEYNHKERKLNLLCWSHPHDDHTVGLSKIIEKYCNEETLILLPNIMSMNNDGLSQLSIDTCKYIQSFCYGKRVGKRYKVRFPSENQMLMTLNFTKKKNMVFKIKNYGPYDNIAYMQNNIDPNKLSISLLFEVNGKYIFLGADTDNMNISCFEDFPNHIHVCKIPHHTSLSGRKFINMLDDKVKSEIACTTSFITSSLPNNKLLKTYCSTFQNVLCTDRNLIDKKVLKLKNPAKSSDSELGYVKITIDVLNNTYDFEMYGQSVEVEPR